jgi:hypothetical protein
MKINVKLILLITLFFLHYSCSEKKNFSKEDTLREFISSIKNDDHQNAWSLLAEEVKYFYNSEGLASGRSGEDEFVIECSRIINFKVEGDDYFLVSSDDENELLIKNNDTLFYPVKFIRSNKTYKIGDRFSVFRIFDSVTEKKMRGR